MNAVLPEVSASQLSGVSSTALVAVAARPRRASTIFMVIVGVRNKIWNYGDFDLLLLDFGGGIRE